MTVSGLGADGRRWTIYCEGFHDRDFLAGCFEDVLHLQPRRREPGIPPGVFAFRHADVDVWIRQCESKSKVVPAFDAALRESNAGRPLGLVMCLDERDDDEKPTAGEALQSARDRLGAMVANASAPEDTLAGSTFDRSTGILQLKDGAQVRLASVTWCCDDHDAEHLPSRQNLERLITAACCDAYPDRGSAVRAWLESRPAPPTDASSHDKAFSWSHMAGWYPSPGGNDFFRAVWRDPAIRAALCRRMATTGLDAVLDGLGVVPPWRSATASADEPRT